MAALRRSSNSPRNRHPAIIPPNDSPDVIGLDLFADYAAGAFDLEYEFPWGWDELEGIHNRTDFDLTAHMEHSGEDLTYFDQENDSRFVPYVIETAAGATRTMPTRPESSMSWLFACYLVTSPPLFMRINLA